MKTIVACIVLIALVGLAADPAVAEDLCAPSGLALRGCADDGAVPVDVEAPSASDVTAVTGTPHCTFSSCLGGGSPEHASCRWYQMWDVRASIESGNGSVEVEVRCGSSVVSCKLESEASPTCSARFAEGPGDFYCGIRAGTLVGDVEVDGRCVDPVNPEAVYHFVLRN